MSNNAKARDVALVGIMIAVIEAAKLSLAAIPNVELTSFLVIMFTLYFGKKAFFAIPGFVLIEVMIFGFEPMWVTAYMYVWPVLFLLTLLVRRFKGTFNMALLSGLYGLMFGFLCSFPYLFLTTSLNPTAGLKSAITWWIAGIPFDVIHGVSNFLIMLVLFNPVSRVLERVNNK